MRHSVLSFVLLVVLAVSTATSPGCRKPPPEGASAGETADARPVPRRIVSLAPSITETLFAVGAGDQVIGVTDYCDYPAEAKTRESVGGYLDINYEALFALKTDLVVLLESQGHQETKARLTKLKLDVLAVDHDSIAGILDSIRAIGERSGHAQEAERLLDDLRTRQQALRVDSTGAGAIPRVLFILDREHGPEHLKSVIVAGPGTWYDDLLPLAGGKNAFSTGTIAYPMVSAEGLIRLDPDVIIEMAPNLERAKLTPADVRRDWDALPMIKAVANKRIYVFSETYAVIPGPRYIQLLEDIHSVLHPKDGAPSESEK